jgi:glycosyltransferase involved in cell wall biosynthesis
VTSNSRLSALKHSLAFLLSRKIDLKPQLPVGPVAIRDSRDCVALDVAGLRRGLHFICIKYSAQPLLMGPRVVWQDEDGARGEDEVFIFEGRDRNEIFGTVMIGPNVRQLYFYPSRLESSLQISAAFVRPITEFSRQWLYGVSFVRYRMFGFNWWLKSLLEQAKKAVQGLYQAGELAGYPAWWQKYGRCSDTELERQRRDHSVIEHGPLISIILPTYESDLELLQAAVDSVFAQTYSRWQLCICDDGSTLPELRQYLEHLAASDARVDVRFREQNGHISQASNDALALARGDYVGFLDHDDSLTPDALFSVGAELVLNREIAVVYSDEDLISAEGEPINGHFKPDWNEDLAHAINYICHFLVIDRALVERVGGFRSGFEGAQDFDLLLRVTENLDRQLIFHIPRVLYHWRAAEGSTASTLANKPYAAKAGLKALADFVARQGISAVAEASEVETAYRVNFQCPEPAPAVSIIVPTRDQLRVLRNCVRSVIETTDYANYELVIVDNGSERDDTQTFLRDVCSDSRVRVLDYNQPFNFSAINNFAVANTTSDIIVLLNNDTEPLNKEWLTELVCQASREDIGAVGAKLLYANDRIQHAGVILGLGGDQIAGHAFKGKHRNEVGSLARTRLVQEYCAVTGACLAVNRDKYIEVGGLDEKNLAVAYNDVDFCLRLRELGYRNLWTPYAQLYHYESYSRGPDSSSESIDRYTTEAEYMRSRWSDLLKRDPFYNPNLSRGLYSYELAWPPHPPH